MKALLLTMLLAAIEQTSYATTVFATEADSGNDPIIQKLHETYKATHYPGRFAKRAEQARIYHEAFRLEQKELFEEALKKYQEALDPRLIDIDMDKDHPLWGIMKTHEMQGNYELALREMDWFLKAAFGKDEYQRRKMELEALISAKSLNSPGPIYEYIQYFRKKDYRDIPPNRISAYGEGVFSSFVKLYDIIGDFDAGIALCNEFRQHATQEPKVQNNYLAVHQAFEEDKKAGRESYITKPGQIGRATRALMASDYFTW